MLRMSVAAHARASSIIEVGAAAANRGQPHRVFVYGTLKNGFYNNKLLVERRATFRGEARTCHPMRMVLGEYGIPYLFDVQQQRGDAAIRGELWEVDDAGLDALDVLEGVDEGMYTRVTLDVEVWWKKDATKSGVQEEEEEGEEEPPRGEVVSAYGYVTGPASIERGLLVDGGGSTTGGASCRVVEQYDLDTHLVEYVPKHKRAAGSLGTRGVLVDATDDDGDE